MSYCSGASSNDSRFVSRVVSQRLSANVVGPRFCGGVVRLVEASVQLKNTPTASLPSNADPGTCLYDSTANKLVVWTGSAWETVSSA